MNSISNWFAEYETLIGWLSAISLALFVLTPPIMAWLVTRLPVDYFTTRPCKPPGSWGRFPTLHFALLATKSAFGAVLVVIGIILLVAPGQGMLMIVAGLLLVEFPGKYRLQCWLVTRPQVWRSINWLRRRAGKSELKPPHAR